MAPPSQLAGAVTEVSSDLGAATYGVRLLCREISAGFLVLHVNIKILAEVL